MKTSQQLNICTACGTQYAPGSELPALCPICSDDRQYIPQSGQAWISNTQLDKQFTVKVTTVNDGLYELKMFPDFAIGQRCFLVVSPAGNILWDCIPLLNEAVIAFIRSKGGLKAIAFSHPHYYSTMNDWASAFRKYCLPVDMSNLTHYHYVDCADFPHKVSATVNFAELSHTPRFGLPESRSTCDTFHKVFGP